MLTWCRRQPGQLYQRLRGDNALSLSGSPMITSPRAARAVVAPDASVITAELLKDVRDREEQSAKPSPTRGSHSA